ncbi:hypothetical protein SRABI106_04135 [Rahnella aquatilis]|nr:hypothetical protein SRABI106_04135 [Rahnella aquatilis]
MRLVVSRFGLIKQPGFQCLIALFDFQPVAVGPDQAVPFTRVIAICFGGFRPLKQSQRLLAVTGAGISQPHRTEVFSIVRLRLQCLLQRCNRAGGATIINLRQTTESRLITRIGQYRLLALKFLLRGNHLRTGVERGDKLLQGINARVAHRLVFNLLQP